jgi:[ribosomal protein S5]-alanine N-acetyltransferase
MTAQLPELEPGSGRSALRLPVPALADAAAGIVLRPWRVTRGDVAALVAAWSDPAVVASGNVPGDVSPAEAERWIRGAPARLDAGLCLDLVVAPLGDDGTVLGEVGLRNVGPMRARAEIGWWIASGHRGRGLASGAVGLLARWALGPPCNLRQVWARIAPGNAASAAAARRAGFARLGAAGGSDVWSYPAPVVAQKTL